MKLECRRLRPGETRSLMPLGDGSDQVNVWSMHRDAAVQLEPGLSLVVCCLRGGLLMECAEGRFELDAGQWLLLGGDAAPVQAELSRGVALLATFEGASLSQELDFAFSRGPAQHTLNRQTLALLNGGKRAFSDASASTEAALLNHCSRILQSLLDSAPDLHAGVRRCPGRTQQRKRQIFARMQRARLFIEGHPEQVVSVSTLARMTSFSPWYFTKAFRQIYGQCPQAFGVDVRLQRARELVMQGELAIGEVAAACGFENACAFARAFGKRYGVSATRMRAASAVRDDVGSASRPARASRGLAARMHRAGRDVMLPSAGLRTVDSRIR
jgi:AraC family transcriptional regulator